MIVACACRHCGTPRHWQKDPSGRLAPRTDGAELVFGSIYPCSRSPTGECEPRVETPGQRMIRELSKAAGDRMSGRVRRRKTRM